MELKNEGLEDDFPFQTGEFQVPAVNFPKCMRKESAISHKNTRKMASKWQGGSFNAMESPLREIPLPVFLARHVFFRCTWRRLFLGEGHHAKVGPRMGLSENSGSTRIGT